MKDTNRNNDYVLAKALADDIEKYAKEHGFKDNIKYSIYKENNEYKVKILYDNENILQKYLEEMEE